MERGVTLDTVFQRLSDGAAPQDIAQNLDPKKYKLTNRIRVYKAFYKSVTLDMNARDASDIGRKLSAGVSTRGCSVDEIIALLAE